MPKVKFISSPTGKPFFLAYNVGDEAEVKAETAKNLISAKLAIPVTTSKKQTATRKNAKAEKRG